MKMMEHLYACFRGSEGVSKDSRDASGRIYFALRGERFDGNDFAASALEQGAVAAVVAQDSAFAAGLFPDTEPGLCRWNGKPVYAVEDPLQTLQELARFHRSRFRIPVLALTGTNGKTTTKELIRTALSPRFRVTATVGNLNNHIGVPLTLLEIRDTTQIALIEMGASAPGEIRQLCSIALPTYGLITNVGAAHLQGFGSLEGVKRTKGELYDYLQRTADTAFYNRDRAELREMVECRPDLKTVAYSRELWQAEVLEETPEHPQLRIWFEGESTLLDLALFGRYNADNVLAALTVARYFGVPFDEACRALSAYVPSNNRSQLQRTERNLLVVDAYNANPSSMAAALDGFAAVNFPHKGVILGEMRELGAVSETEHRKVVERLAQMTLETVWLVGASFASCLPAGCLETLWPEEAGRPEIRFFPDVEAVRACLKETPLTGRTLLLKGSNGVQLTRLPDLL